jgi:hypothetical protein
VRHIAKVSESDSSDSVINVPPEDNKTKTYMTLIKKAILPFLLYQNLNE